MEKKTNVYVFVDALGWEIVSKYNFLGGMLANRQKVKMQFGYSSTAIPTILSGKSPKEHGHFSFFYYDPKNSPFKEFKYLKYCFGAGLHPKCLTNRGRVRRIISRYFAKLKGYTGYFQLYGVPYNRLRYFDYCEKGDIFAEEGLAPVKNLRDVLIEKGLKFHVSDWRKNEGENVEAACKDISKGDLDFAFVYTADFDGFMHDNVFDENAIAERLKYYEGIIEKIHAALKESGRPFKLTVISDHGMTPLRGTCDIGKILKAMPLKFGKDYASMLDSTMARFWYLNGNARKIIRETLEAAHLSGRFITDDEKKIYGIDFHDCKFGDDIFLMDAGVQISPSDMGAKPLKGMHGFSPEDKDSYAAFLSTEPPSAPLAEVKDFFKLMQADINAG